MSSGDWRVASETLKGFLFFFGILGRNFGRTPGKKSVEDPANDVSSRYRGASGRIFGCELVRFQLS